MSSTTSRTNTTAPTSQTTPSKPSAVRKLSISKAQPAHPLLSGNTSAATASRTRTPSTSETVPRSLIMSTITQRGDEQKAGR